MPRLTKSGLFAIAIGGYATVIELLAGCINNAAMGAKLGAFGHEGYSSL